MFFYSFAKGLGLNPQVGGSEESTKLLDIRPESGIRFQIASVDPVPGEVFHEYTGYAKFLSQSKPQWRNVTEYQIGFRFTQNVPYVFETFVVEGKEASEPGNGLMEVVFEGGFLDESDVGFEPVCPISYFRRQVLVPKPVGQGAEYVDL